MDASNQTPPEHVRPMNQAHTPISMEEINLNIHNQSPSSGKSIIFNLTSFLVLAGIVGITVWLYMHNRMVKSIATPKSTTAKQKYEPKARGITKTDINQKHKEILYGNLSCLRFNTIEEALNNPDEVCILDLTGKNLKTLPSTISSFKNITELYLTSNKLESLPKEIGSFTKLRILYAPNNKISAIPTEILLLTNLTTLNLTNNQLTTIPEQLSTLAKLSTLLLTNNNLTSVPDSLAKLPLTTFTIYENDFSDSEVTSIKKKFQEKNVSVSTKETVPQQ